MASSMSIGSSFTELHQDFVLKLKFVGDGDVSQIRRVRLPRITKDGVVSYEELVGLAISFVIDPENHEQNFEVKLTYHDVDGDKVVIGSSEELVDAVDQYSNERMLRVTAEVKRCGPKKANPKAKYSTSSNRASAPDPATTTNNAGTQAGPAVAGSVPVLHHVVESVVDIILRAAVAMNGGSGKHPFYAPDGTPANNTSTAEGAPAPAPATAPATEPAGETPPVSNSDQVPAEEVDEPTTAEEVSSEAQPTTAAVAEVRAEDTNTNSLQAEEATEEEEEVPFIHGRHTCDSCLTTPIVGKRYHAVNMPDYDLCEKCFSSYKGKEITFDVVELERDRCLQDRWNRRRGRMNGGCGRRRFGPPGHHNRWGPNGGPNAKGGRGPQGPGRGPRGAQNCGRRGKKQAPPPFPPPPPPAPQGGPTVCPARPVKVNEGDVAMEEAIRRSLQDLMISKKPEPSAPIEQEVVEKTTPSATVSVNSDTTANATLREEVPSEQVDDVPAEEVEETSVVETQANAEQKKSDKTALDSTSASVMSGSSEASRKSLSGYMLFARENRSKVREEHPDFSLNQIGDELGNMWGALSDEERKEYQKFSAVRPLTSQPLEVPLPAEEQFPSGISVVEGEENQEEAWEPSFSSDAAGNGDVADLLGSTLDKCAQAIDAMVSELGRTSSHEESDSGSFASSFVGVEEEVEEQENNGAETADPEAAVTEETDGATILEPTDGPSDEMKTDSTAVKEGRSEDGWQVVSKDHQISGDEELARAAQMVGSALFNSDMKSSGEILSTMTGSAASDAFSYASSVPTSVPSIRSVSVAQLERWAPQLTQLHDMGFDEDAVCVEILERLTAANIGVDENDEISVQQVVNELWKS